MKNINEYYYKCEKGHITVGNSARKLKCDQGIREIKLVKTGKAKTEKEIIKERTCGAEVKEIVKIPEELALDNVWDFDVIKAFMTGQTNVNLKIHFITLIQKYFTQQNSKLSQLEESINILIQGDKSGDNI